MGTGVAARPDEPRVRGVVGARQAKRGARARSRGDQDGRRATASTSPTTPCCPTGPHGAPRAAWGRSGGLHRLCLQRAPGRGPSRIRGFCSAAAAGPASTRPRAEPGAATQASGLLVAPRALVVALAEPAAASGFSNWSHDVGGYPRPPAGRNDCPPEAASSAGFQFGCFTAADARRNARIAGRSHGTTASACWASTAPTRSCTRCSWPYVRGGGPLTAFALRACRSSGPCASQTRSIPPRLDDHPNAYGYGPALWVAPVLDDGAREREEGRDSPRGRWDRELVGPLRCFGGGRGGSRGSARADPGSGFRAGSIVVTYPALACGARASATLPESERPAGRDACWGEPRPRATHRRAAGRRHGRPAGGAGFWSMDRTRTARSSSTRFQPPKPAEPFHIGKFSAGFCRRLLPGKLPAAASCPGRPSGRAGLGRQNSIPDPTTRSLTVRETSTSPAPARRAEPARAMWTAIPRRCPRRSPRTRRYGARRATLIPSGFGAVGDRPARTLIARAGPSNVARESRPPVRLDPRAPSERRANRPRARTL